MVSDATDEYQNAIQVRASATKAAEIMKENYVFRLEQVKADSEKRRIILQ